MSSSETERLTPVPAPSGRTVAPGRGPRRARAAVDRFLDDAMTPQPGLVAPHRRELGAVLGIWAVGRVVNLVILGCWYSVSRAAGWGFGPRGVPVGDFLTFLTDWDADRYGRIARIGYPATLPTDPSGDILPNDWAFLPVFPMLERVLGEGTGIGWRLAGVGLSIVFSAGATVLLFLLARAVAAPARAWMAVVLFTFAPLSFVFVLGYAESLFLLLLFGALLLAVRRRYAGIVPLGVTAAFTRPGALALALALGIVFLARWYRRRTDPFPARERAWLIAAGLSTAVAGLSWSWIADAVTGVPHAYVLTETAWWTPLIGTGAFVPLTPWFRFAGTYLGVFGVVLVLAIMVLFARWVLSPPVRRLGLVMVAFAASYGLYLFGVFLPQQSTFRLAMPLSPLLADERLAAGRRRRTWLVTGAVLLQVVAVLLLWTVGYP